MRTTPPWRSLFSLGILILLLTGAALVLQKKSIVTADPVFLSVASRGTAYYELAKVIEQTLKDTPGETMTGQLLGGISPQHLPTAIPVHARFYNTLKNMAAPETIVIIGPDHRSLAHSDLVISLADYVTPFGRVQVDRELAQKLLSGRPEEEDQPFENEHAIISQVLFISTVFPDAKIVPILAKSSLTQAVAREFGEFLGNSLGENQIVIASIDFSHNLTAEAAFAIDRVAASLLAKLTPESTRGVDSDSTQSLIALTSAMLVAEAKDFNLLEVENSATFTGNPDNTTGYVTGIYSK